MWFFLAFRNLFRNIRRTIAILLTVAMGAGALLSFNSFIDGVLQRYCEDTIHSHYGYGQVNTRGYRDSTFQDPLKHWMENPNQLETELLKIPGVTQVFPRVSFSAILKNDDATVSGLGQGINGQEESKFFYSLNVEEGSSLSNQENGILLGRGLANALKVHPGDTVTVVATSTKGYIDRAKFVVTGIFHTGSVDFDGRNFRVQLAQAQKLLKTKNVEQISLGLTNLSAWKEVATKVESLYPNLEATPFDVLDAIYYQHSVDWLNAQFRVVQCIILSIVLLGIFNTISAAILERKQEIGNLRANGESKFQVMRLIMVEGVLLAIFGSCIGMAITYVVLSLFIDQGILMPPAPGMTRQFFVSFAFSWKPVLYTLLLSCGAASIASFFAGVKVAKMPIATSLRSH